MSKFNPNFVYTFISRDNLFLTMNVEFYMPESPGTRTETLNTCSYLMHSKSIDSTKTSHTTVIDPNTTYFENLFKDKLNDGEKLLKFHTVFSTFITAASNDYPYFYNCRYAFLIDNHFSRNFYLPTISSYWYPIDADKNFYKLSIKSTESTGYYNPFTVWKNPESFVMLNKKMFKSNINNCDSIKISDDIIIPVNYSIKERSGSSKPRAIDFVYDIFKNIANVVTGDVFNYKTNKNKLSIGNIKYENDNFLIIGLYIGTDINIFNTSPELVNKVKPEQIFTFNTRVIFTKSDFSDWYYIVEVNSKDYILNGVIKILRAQIKSGTLLTKQCLFAKAISPNKTSLKQIGDLYDDGELSGLRITKNEYALKKNNNVFSVMYVSAPTEYPLKYPPGTNYILDNLYQKTNYINFIIDNNICKPFTTNKLSLMDSPIKKLMDKDAVINITKINDYFSTADVSFKLTYDITTNKISVNSNLLTVDQFISENSGSCYADKIGILGVLLNMDQINGSNSKYIKLCDAVIQPTIINFGDIDSPMTRNITSCTTEKDQCCFTCSTKPNNKINDIDFMKYMRNALVDTAKEYTVKILLGNNPDLKYDLVKIFKLGSDDVNFLNLTKNNFSINKKFIKKTDKYHSISYSDNPESLKTSNPVFKNLYTDDNGLFTPYPLTINYKPTKTNTLTIVIVMLFVVFAAVIMIVIFKKREELRLKYIHTIQEKTN